MVPFVFCTAEKEKERKQENRREDRKTCERSPIRSELQQHRASPHTGTQMAHSFEGLVSMAGVAVVRGALNGPQTRTVGTVSP